MRCQVQVGIAVPVRAEDDVPSVWRPGRAPVGGVVVGQSDRLAAFGRNHEDLGVALDVTSERDL